VDEVAQEDLPVKMAVLEGLPMEMATPEELLVDEEAQEDLPVDEKEDRVTPSAKWRRPRGWLQAGVGFVASDCQRHQQG
jgi:hypothetical protein